MDGSRTLREEKGKTDKYPFMILPFDFEENGRFRMRNISAF